MERSVEELQRDVYRSMTYAERWQQAMALRQAAWDLKVAAIRHAHPDYDDDRVLQLVREAFLYADA